MNLYPQKLAITSPTSGGRSVGIVHSRTPTMEFVLFCILLLEMYVNNLIQFSGIISATGYMKTDYIKRPLGARVQLWLG
jgi:hypothetical protein